MVLIFELGPIVDDLLVVVVVVLVVLVAVVAVVVYIEV